MDQVEAEDMLDREWAAGSVPRPLQPVEEFISPGSVLSPGESGSVSLAAEEVIRISLPEAFGVDEGAPGAVLGYALAIDRDHGLNPLSQSKSRSRAGGA